MGPNLDDDELELFSAACVKRGLSDMDFLVKVDNDYSSYPSDTSGPKSREITVIRIRTGKSKRYPAGKDDEWIVAFEDDLLNLHFE